MSVLYVVFQLFLLYLFLYLESEIQFSGNGPRINIKLDHPMLSRPVSIALCDKHTMFRKTLKSYLLTHADLAVVAEDSDLTGILKKIPHLPADTLIADITSFPDGVRDVVKTINLQDPRLKIIILSMNHNLEILSDLMDAGIHGYISKSDEPEELIRCVMATKDNHIYRNTLFTDALYFHKQQLSHNRNLNKDAILLNERERKMLQMMWEDKSTKEIADSLFLGVRSVEKIRQEMKEKVSVRSNIGLVRYAIHQKIIEIGINSF